MPISASFLCNMVDQLCAAYVIANRLQRHGFLHEVTLARKWIEKLHTGEQLKSQECRLLNMFVELIPSLLSETFTGSSGKILFLDAIGRKLNMSPGFLLHEGSSRIDYQIRNVLVSRLYVLSSMHILCSV